MKSKNSKSFSIHCPFCQTLGLSPSPLSRRVHRKGYFSRSSDGRRIARFFCLNCKKNFSYATFSPCFRQKKRRLNVSIRKLYFSGVSLRRIARLLGVNRKTVVRKFLFLAGQAKLNNQKFLIDYLSKKETFQLQFDEMESSERSKCLPVSIPLVLERESRKILAFRVCKMPAKGLLAKVSYKKYGPRDDERTQAAHDLFSQLAPFAERFSQIESDQNPKYPTWIRAHFPKLKHKAYLGRRGCVVGQGELKKIGFDPLFDLNHTCAMLRANINRLFRRTWCTTKVKERLADHIAIYVEYHNSVLTA